jgi:ABC-type antimicrobial peptide transport system permease subunit
LSDVRSSLPVISQGTLAEHFGAALEQPRFLAQVMGAVSMLAMLLAALGIYAVVAFNVARRAGELGIRVALGANPGRVVRVVVGETAAAVALGLATGLGLAALGLRWLETALFGIQVLDPITFAGAMAVLMLVSCVAAFLPARRAAHANPANALRAV